MSQSQLTFLTKALESESPIPTNEYCDTSVHSRDALARNKNNYRRRIFDYIEEKHGATCDEVESALDLRHQTASCFIRFLTQDEFLRESGDRRITRAGRKAIVWVVNK